MSPERPKHRLLTDHLDIWAAAEQPAKSGGRGRAASNGKSPHGIQKLRELILELAVRGKLVPQDPSEEPASELLKRIAAEKKRLIKEGKINSPKSLPEIGPAEISFELPDGWEWVRFGNVYTLEYGDNLPSEKRTNTGEYPVYGSNGIVGSHSTSFVKSPCIVVGRKGSAGALNLSLAKGCCVTDVAYYCIPPSALDLTYSFKLFHTIGLDTLGKGIKPGLNRNEAYVLPIAIPPLAEQHRIVAKVDELMALCDQLEQEQTDNSNAHQTLVETLLATLTHNTARPELVEGRTSTGSARTDFAAAWQRIAAHFDTLFTTEQSIDQLKQTILQLAVMGKLVPQDPSDEPASELLKRIATERTRLVDAGEARQKNDMPDIGEDEPPYMLPNGWEWVRLGQIISISSGDGLISANMKSSGGIPVYGGNGINGYHDKANISKPTLVIGRVGYYCGSIHITAGSAWITDNAFVTTFSEENIYLGFLYWLLRGTNLKENENATAQPVISGRKVYPIVVGLPPKEEQHRIVAKVDELMAICDALKARLNEAQITQVQLADAIVEQAVA